MKGFDTVTSQTQPVWTPRPFVRALWVATAESPEWILERTNAFTVQLQGLFGVGSWRTPDNEAWNGTEEEQTQLLLGTVFVNDAYEPPQPEPESGYRLLLRGHGSGVDIDVSVVAGASTVGGRVPGHYLNVDVRETIPGTFTSENADALCAAVASTWQPATLKFTDAATNSAARRGNWKIGIGYRTWISTDVGTVAQAAEGLTVSELAGGTMISAPDHWPAQRVVATMTETLAMNDLDEVPR
ncbi:hypothetical protein [Mycolicibacterium iranicum]|uniref:Uncharacterized protein n=1 Tax=Mycolicibacterium iranicum TaxID=912594 RepID=A0ABT4HMN4_MYCIR|nr:hypothetical protein [Mycolicibacterium iranicum]MCZ0730907.1 hypothetical protein [Mycolicibacterium iranicum]